MSSQSLLEKLQLNDEKNLLLQGLPLSIEKQFIKFSFSKNVTPLLKSKKIDFALIFAFSQKQLKEILNEVIPALHADAKFWIAYPKASSKIASDLCRDASWDFIAEHGYEIVRLIAVDNLWSAAWFKKTGDTVKKAPSFSSANPAPGIDYTKRTIKVPEELQQLLDKDQVAAAFFQSLAFSHKREYVEWIVSAKKEETKARRLETTMEKLSAQKKTFNAK
ncbi:YdeI/OmpD-associated family protein [Ferruginibacter sp. SUN106]|uniref:YdeI/OmpD-associated family protein n=1 Tax=Ferruginibacter sp. SUN106 TaxID=2978348 RepID=UPI003D36F202